MGGLSLTPRQRLRHDEPSWFFKGQTTSFWASDTLKEEVIGLRGMVRECPAGGVVLSHLGRASMAILKLGVAST
jgi:hypothetical protein